jgi:hypothetical protein
MASSTADRVTRTGPMTVVEVIVEMYDRVARTGPMTVVEVIVEMYDRVARTGPMTVVEVLVEMCSRVARTGPMTVVEVERCSRVMEEDLARIMQFGVADLLGVIRSCKVVADSPLLVSVETVAGIVVDALVMGTGGTCRARSGVAVEFAAEARIEVAVTRTIGGSPVRVRSMLV